MRSDVRKLTDEQNRMLFDTYYKLIKPIEEISIDEYLNAPENFLNTNFDVQNYGKKE